MICQRANFWWGSKLRRRYKASIQTALCVVGVGGVVFAMLRQWDMATVVLTIAAPLSPAFPWGMREARRQGAAALALSRFRELGENLWADIVKGSISEAEATIRSRQLQDAMILLRRQTNPLVFDWIYRCLRRGYEAQMNFGADDIGGEHTGHALPVHIGDGPGYATCSARRTAPRSTPASWSW